MSLLDRLTLVSFECVYLSVKPKHTVKTSVYRSLPRGIVKGDHVIKVKQFATLRRDLEVTFANDSFAKFHINKVSTYHDSPRGRLLHS